MAEETTTPHQQSPKPVVSTEIPEPDLDKLLAATPEFAELFGEPKKESGTTEPQKEPAQDAVEESPAPEVLPSEETPPEEPATEEPVEEPKEPDAVQKRIDQLTAQRKTAEEKAAKLDL